LLSLLFACTFPACLLAYELHFSAGGGYFLQHSENSKPVTVSRNFSWNKSLDLGLSLHLGRDIFLCTSLGIIADKQKITQRPAVGLSGHEHGIEVLELSHTSYPFDIVIQKRFKNKLRLGGGLCYSGVNRSLEMTRVGHDRFVERLGMQGFGPVIWADYRMHVYESKNIALDLSAKLRKIKAVKFDDKNLQIGNYEYNFTDLSLHFKLVWLLR
jgi:hypothetical protein